LGTVIVVTSGKGGVGKTTTSAALATGLALRGNKTVVIDFDVGLRNLDLIMGFERRVRCDSIDVIRGEAALDDALLKDKRVDNLFLLPTSQTSDKDALTQDGVERILADLTARFDYVLCDSPAGIERGAIMSMYFADRAIVVTNPEVSSVRDADRIIGLLSSRTRRAEQGREPVYTQLLLSRYDATRVVRGEMLSVDDVQEILSIPLLGVIPECRSILQASNDGLPVVFDSTSNAGKAYADAVGRLVGEDLPHRFLDVEKKGLLARLFGIGS